MIYLCRIRHVWPLTFPQTIYARITVLNLLLNSHPIPDPVKEALWSSHVNHSPADRKQRSDNLRELWLFENRNTEALNQMAVGPVREHEGDTVEPHTEVQLCPWPRALHMSHICTNAQADKCKTDTREWNYNSITSFESFIEKYDFSVLLLTWVEQSQVDLSQRLLSRFALAFNRIPKLFFFSDKLMIYEMKYSDLSYIMSSILMLFTYFTCVDLMNCFHACLLLKVALCGLKSFSTSHVCM